MKKFKFRMQSLLQLREQELEAWQLKMAEELQRLQLLNNQTQAIQGQIESTLDAPITSPQDYPQRLQFVGYLRDQQAELRNYILQQQQIIDGIQVELSQALAKKKMLEKLKEKQEKQHFDFWQKKQQDEMEELSINRYYRNQLTSA